MTAGRFLGIMGGMRSTHTLDLAEALFDKHASLYSPLEGYPAIVSLHGLTRMAVITGEERLRQRARAELDPFLRGERQFRCNFPNYRCGGIGTAFLLWKGLLPEAATTVRHYAEEIMTDAPRDPAGILCHPADPPAHKIWIDVAFAVTPFLLFSGLALGEDRYLEEAFQQTAKMVAVLRDPGNGLLHQARNFNGPGRLTEDAWSRGNGWALYALSELVAFLPAHHPRRECAVRMLRDLLQACLAVRHPGGLWCQEMTEKMSYVETSGSALILYALGTALEQGLVGPEHRPVLEDGLSALLPYITGE